MDSLDIKKFTLLGVNVSAITIERSCVVIDSWITQNTPNYVCVTGVHGIMESQYDSLLRDIHNNAGLVVPDGRPLSWIGMLLGYNNIERVYGPNLMLAMCKIAEDKGYTNYLYGGALGIAEQLRDKLIKRFPKIKIIGTYTPSFRPLSQEEELYIAKEFERLSPDIVWIGLSTPKQEYWMSNHINTLNAKVMVGVGAAFDFISGNKKGAPEWMQVSGLEWFFRLCTEPRRLWKRYLVGNSVFLYLICKEFIVKIWKKII